jgi:pyrroloquinoline quinone biosynthesis protein D
MSAGAEGGPDPGRPTLIRHCVLRFDPTRQCDVLLLPERVVLLNSSSAEILRMCDGHRTDSELIAELENRYPNSDGLAEDIGQFLMEAANNGWLEP